MTENLPTKTPYSKTHKNELPALRQRIADLKLIGISDAQIGETVGLGWRQVKRHWDAWIVDHLEDLKRNKEKNSTKLLARYEASLNRVSRKAAENYGKDDIKFGNFSKLEKEYMDGYERMLRSARMLDTEDVKTIDPNEPVVQAIEDYKKYLKEKLNANKDSQA